MIIRITTTIGISNRAANGTDMFEPPFNRILLPKKPILGSSRSLALPDSSSLDAFDIEGIRFASSWTSPMDVARAPTARGTDKAALPGQIRKTEL